MEDEDSLRESSTLQSFLEASVEDLAEKRLQKPVQILIDRISKDGIFEEVVINRTVDVENVDSKDVKEVLSEDINEIGSELLQLIQENGLPFETKPPDTKMDTTNDYLQFDYFKRRKWHVQAQSYQEHLQCALKNYKAHRIRKILDDCATARAFHSGIRVYLDDLSEKISTVTGVFRELLKIYHDVRPVLNELNHMKKVLNHVCRKYTIPRLAQHIERLDAYEINIQDAGSVEYLEDIVRTRKLFEDLREDTPTNRLGPGEGLNGQYIDKHIGFTADCQQIRRCLWETYYSLNFEEVKTPEEEVEETNPFVKGGLRDRIFQTATEFHMIALTLHVMVRSMLLRMKSAFDTAQHMKKQYLSYKLRSLKLEVFEKTLEDCMKEWISYDKIVLTFKNSDQFKSSIPQNVPNLGALVPLDYAGWDLPLIASRADKILLRRVKKKRIISQNKNLGSPSAGHKMRNGLSDRRGRHSKEIDSALGDEGYHRSRRRHSRVINPLTKGAPETDQGPRKPSLAGNKTYFDAYLEDFTKHLDEQNERDLLEELKIPDLASAIQEEPLECANVKREVAGPAHGKNIEIKTRFCEYPLYTDMSLLTEQDRHITRLQSEYYEKLLSLIKSKDEFRKHKVEISNVRTKMMNLVEEFATVRKYIVTRDESRLITSLPEVVDIIQENKETHEKESQKLNAEVKRSLRLIKKGKFEAAEWLMSMMVPVKDDRLSDEEDVSKKSSSASDQFKSSGRSEPKETSSASIVNLTTEADKEVTWETTRQEAITEEVEDTPGKTVELKKMTTMAFLLGEKKVVYSLCGAHSRAVPPFCCLQDLLLQQNKANAVQMVKSQETDLNTGKPSCVSLLCGLLKHQNELDEILRQFHTTKRGEDCEFPSFKDEELEGEYTSHQSSLKLEATLGSWSDSELEEALESTSCSSHDKLNSAMEKLLENKHHIIRQLTHRYIMEKCGELFGNKQFEMDQSCGNLEDDYLSSLQKTAKFELTEHRHDLMKLYQKCSTELIENNKDSEKKQSLYEARMRSEKLREIRELKDRIKEKRAVIERMEEELERMRLRKYPTFSQY